jgi:hypothetical protein
MLEFAAYGLGGALLGVLLQFVPNKLWPFFSEKVYAGRVKREVEAREEARRHEDRLYQLVQDNTEVMTKVSVAVAHLEETFDRAVTALNARVDFLYQHLDLDRSERPSGEDK